MERICLGMEYVHEMWASLASIVLSIVILYQQVFSVLLICETLPLTHLFSGGLARVPSSGGNKFAYGRGECCWQKDRCSPICMARRHRQACQVSIFRVHQIFTNQVVELRRPHGYRG